MSSLETKNKNLNITKTVVRQGLIAAIYVVLTITAGDFSYLSLQFRYSEVLNLLAFLNPLNSFGVTIGVFISNFWSPLGTYDLIFGTLHTAISLFFISKSKNLIVASIWPTVFSFIIGFELSVLAGFGGFWIMTGSVMLSEFVIMTIISVPLYYKLMKNKAFMNLFKN